MTTETPADTLRAAADRAQRIGDPLHLTLALWLDTWAGVDLSEHGPMPEDAHHALAVARRILGTTEQADTVTAPTVDRAAVLREAADEIAGIDFHPNARARSLDIATGLARRLRRMADEAQQPTPAPAEETK